MHPRGPNEVAQAQALFLDPLPQGLQGSNSASRPSRVAGGQGDGTLLEEATYDELALAVTTRLERDRVAVAQQLAMMESAERQLETKRQNLEQLERRLFALASDIDDVVELNIGGQLMSTSRSVLRSAEGSLLSGMFSGNFDNGLKRDKEGRIFMDVDPHLFAKILSHLRLRGIASPDYPAPLPQVPDDLQAEYDMLVRYFGLETFMYGDGGASGDVFQKIAELTGVDQCKLQTHELIRIVLSSTGGVPASNHEEVLGPLGFSERSLENSYGAHPNTITISFWRHRVRVEGMEFRVKAADTASHMSNQWAFRHGTESINMHHTFTRTEPSTGRIDVSFASAFVDEVQWTFPKDFCLEHIVLYGRVMAK